MIRVLFAAALAAAASSAAAAPPAAEAFFDSADRDRDGWVSYVEFRDARLAAFDRADANHDRVLTRSEAGALRKTLGLPARKPGARTLASLRAIDANGDRKLSRAEFLAAGQARFTQLDRDNDGRLSRADVRAALDD